MRDTTAASSVDGRDDVPAGYDNVAYAKRCVETLGMAPEALDDLNCLAGTPIDIKFNDTAVTTATWQDFVAQGRRCDNPQWLSHGCHPYDFLQVRQVGDVEIILNCRQKYFPDQSAGDADLIAGMSKTERFQAYAAARRQDDGEKTARYRRFAFLFNDLGLILRNGQTGQVCYFTKYDEDFFGGFIPNPLRAVPPTAAEFQATVRRGLTDATARLADDAELNLDQYKTTASDFYFSPSSTGNCVTCHAYGGIKWSPFIRAARLLPAIGDVSQVPYLPVGKEIAAALRSSGAVEVEASNDDTCTRCHRLVSQGGRSSRTCNSFERAVGDIGSSLESLHTERANNFPHRAWMPLGHRQATQADYDQKFKAGIDLATCCCKHPTASGCSWKRFGPTAAEVDDEWRQGAAPEAIAAAFDLAYDAQVQCSQ